MAQVEFPRAPQGWHPANSLEEAIENAKMGGIDQRRVVFSLEPATARSGWVALNEVVTGIVEGLALVDPEAQEELHTRLATQVLSSDEVRREFGV